jgi:hypothetical protein
MLEDTENLIGWAVPSPDGSHIAFYKQSMSSDVWLLSDF